MSYSIALKLFQTNPSTYYRVVEQTVWNYANGGTWSDTDGIKTLTMGGSGTSGTIRFRSAENGKSFIVAVGVHNYKRWVDIVPNPTNDQTGMIVNGQYYNNGARSAQREAQLATYTNGNITVTYTVTDGNTLAANIIV